MAGKSLLAIVAIASLITGCVTRGDLHPDFAAVHPKIRKLAIIPPEVIVGHVTNVPDGEGSKRLVVRSENGEAIYRQTLVSDQALLFGGKGYQIDKRMVTLLDEGGPEFKSRYLSFVRDFEYAVSDASLPASKGGQQSFETNVQKSLKPLAEYTDADAFLYTRFGKLTWDRTSTVEHVITAALFGFISADDKATIEISCIERDTGKLLWREGFTTHQDYFVHMSRLVGGFPAAAGGNPPAK